MRHPLLTSFAVGFATALLVGVAVTGIAARWIAFSLFVGIPAGVVAGVVAVAATYALLTRQSASPAETDD